MKSMHGNTRKRKSKLMGRKSRLTREEVEVLDLDGRLELIKQLIPLGLLHIGELLEREVEEIAGARYHRRERCSDTSIYRHGSNSGSVKVYGQRLGITVPRVRTTKGEVPLATYQQLHNGSGIDEKLFKRVLYGISCRDYEGAAEAIPGSIGLSKSTVSRQFVAASAEQLKKLQERELSGLDVVALFLDGKTFADETMVIALGITLSGEKIILGTVETDTENARVLTSFLQSLLDRGLDISRGILAIIDGAKGIRSAVKSVFKKRVVIQRCQWHKRENIVSYLPKSEQDWMRKRLQLAYNRPTLKEALEALQKIRADLEVRNQSAMASLDEGLDETLSLHRLDIFAAIGRSFKTTNCLESINSLVEQRCAKVDRWKNSAQKQRWLASALLDIEPRLRRVHGYNKLYLLRVALIKELDLSSNEAAA